MEDPISQNRTSGQRAHSQLPDVPPTDRKVRCSRDTRQIIGKRCATTRGLSERRLPTRAASSSRGAALERERRGVTREQRSGQRRKSGLGHERAEGPLVHAKRRAGQRRSAVLQTREIERALEGAIFAGSPVRREYERVEIESSCARHSSASGVESTVVAES